MKKSKGAEVATVAVTPETTSKTLKQLLYAAREKSGEKIDQLDSMLEFNFSSRNAVPEVLLSVSFLMDWYTDGINVPLSGRVSNGLSGIVRRCGTKLSGKRCAGQAPRCPQLFRKRC